MGVSIGEAAAQSGLPAKTIRYYEDIGLVRPLRSANGYRAFDGKNLQALEFLARARSLGFSIEECRELLAFQADAERASADVKRVAVEHLARIDAKIAELTAMRRSLADLAERCAGNETPDCAILRTLAGA
ncbi:Cu(I)-responsive transcriptional regulator [Amaricoccus macauensis]|uniref:Cu(I)-responsive transcriptional regulator n=1 Tax=Amaricoccus macauensis TaxID=57001 RepID=A0A840SST9_9RHOB|nr:MerR family DNA-binding protein [Amaricoccus macauensis]MBB5223595.1 Cu(I)-responsive transcriptional regulator [Amaricoccus macauensis]